MNVTTDKYRLMRGDCLERMAEIPDGSIDMVLCDLPYGTTACKWDSVIPFAPLWAQYGRVCKRNAAIVLTASQPFTSALVMSNIEGFKYEMIWEKDNGTNFPSANFQPMRVHENILVFGDFSTTFRKGGAYNYRPQFTEGKPYRCVSGKQKHETIRPGSSAHDGGFETVNEGRRFPRSVQKFNRDRDKIHPTQKPIALMEYLIRTYTNEGETVLDNTMGSGTTGVACARAGRRFVGIERDEGYFAIARQRIEEAYASTPLFSGMPNAQDEPRGK